MRGQKFDLTRRSNKQISQSTTQAAILSPVTSLIGILDFAMALLCVPCILPYSMFLEQLASVWFTHIIVGIFSFFKNIHVKEITFLNLIQEFIYSAVEKLRISQRTMAWWLNRIIHRLDSSFSTVMMKYIWGTLLRIYGAIEFSNQSHQLGLLKYGGMILLLGRLYPSVRWIKLKIENMPYWVHYDSGWIRTEKWTRTKLVAPSIYTRLPDGTQTTPFLVEGPELWSSEVNASNKDPRLIQRGWIKCGAFKLSTTSKKRRSGVNRKEPENR